MLVSFAEHSSPLQMINTSQAQKSLFFIRIYLACRYVGVDAPSVRAQLAKKETRKPRAVVGLHDGIFM